MKIKLHAKDAIIIMSYLKDNVELIFLIANLDIKILLNALNVSRTLS